MRIAVLMGGISSEREISIKTGTAVLESLVRLGYEAFAVVLDRGNIIRELVNNNYDLAFNCLHGEFGEDGRIQALLDILEKKYTGSDFQTSAVCMNKIFTKKLLENYNVLMPKTYNEIDDIEKYPVIVKPISEGSSVGVYICEDANEVYRAIESLGSKKTMIEEYIKGDEITVGVLERKSLAVVRIIPENSEFYDYKSKYTKGMTIYESPAQIDKEVYDFLMDESERISEKLEIEGSARLDYILKDGKAYFLEINTIPGMTELSLLPMAAKAQGMTFDNLIKKMIEKFAK